MVKHKIVTLNIPVQLWTLTPKKRINMFIDYAVIFSVSFFIFLFSFVIGFICGYCHIVKKIKRYIGDDRSLLNILFKELKKY